MDEYGSRASTLNGLLFSRLGEHVRMPMDQRPAARFTLEDLGHSQVHGNRMRMALHPHMRMLDPDPVRQVAAFPD